MDSKKAGEIVELTNNMNPRGNLPLRSKFAIMI